jgi:hypothetical protein
MDNNQSTGQREGSIVRRSPESTSAARQRGAAPHPLVRLQRLIGNGEVTRLLAQRAAEEEDELQRASDDEGAEVEEEELQRASDDEDELQRKVDPGAEGGSASAASAAQIGSMRGSGAPLTADVQARMETRFDTDFNDVRVHTGPQASALNHDLSSKAFTTGNDIFLRSEVGAADSRLLAHELTHVVQQRSMDTGSAGLQVGPAGDAYEREADSVADSLGTAAPAQRNLDEDGARP